MDKSNKLDLRILALLMLSGYILTFPQASRQPGHQLKCLNFKALILWHSGTEATFLQQKDFLLRLITEIPKCSQIIISTLGNTSSDNVMKFTKDDSSWINKFAKFKYLVNSGDGSFIPNASIRKAIDMYLDHNETTKIAEELFLVVDDRSKIDDEENATKDLKRKKTFVIYAGEKAPPKFWTNLATDKHHLLKLSGKSDDIGDEDAFIQLSYKDSRLFCDTNLYWDRSRCVSCTHICSMVTKTVPQQCSYNCRYFDRTPSSTVSSTHQTDGNEVGIALSDKKWPVALVVAICILVTMVMICILVFVFWRCLNAHRQSKGENAQPGTRLNAVQIDKHPILEEGDVHQVHDSHINRTGSSSSEELSLSVGNSDDEIDHSETETERENRPLVDIRTPDGYAEFSTANENTNVEENVSLPNEQIEGQAEEPIDENDPVITDRKIPVVLEFRDADELNANGNTFNGPLVKLHPNRNRREASDSS